MVVVVVVVVGLEVASWDTVGPDANAERRNKLKRIAAVVVQTGTQLRTLKAKRAP